MYKDRQAGRPFNNIMLFFYAWSWITHHKRSRTSFISVLALGGLISLWRLWVSSVCPKSNNNIYSILHIRQINLNKSKSQIFCEHIDEDCLSKMHGQIRWPSHPSLPLKSYKANLKLWSFQETVVNTTVSWTYKILDFSFI